MSCDHRLLPSGWFCDECGFQKESPLEMFFQDAPDIVPADSWLRCRHTTTGGRRCERKAFHAGMHQAGDHSWMMEGGAGQCNRHQIPNHRRCLLPRGHIGSHVFEPRTTQCRAVDCFENRYHQCKLPAGHGVVHLAKDGTAFETFNTIFIP